MDSLNNSPQTISAWSFSRLVEVYEKCPYRARLEYVEKRPKPEPKPDDKGAIARARGVAVHKGAECYIKGEGVLVPELNKSEIVPLLNDYKAAFAEGRANVEEQWGFTRDWTSTDWFGDNTWLRVICDVVKSEDSVIEMTDWKTGKRLNNEVKHSQQGILNSIASFIKYPNADEVRIRFAYVDENKVVTRQYKRDTVMRLLPSWHERGVKMTTDTEFKPKPNKNNCRFCPYGPNNGGDRSCVFGVEL